MRILKLTLKTAVFTAAVLVLLAAAAVAAINWLLPSATVKPLILDYAGRYLDRRISIGDVSVNIFTGIALHDVVIGDAEERDPPFIAARGVTLGYRLLPLLRKRIEITRVHLDGPSVSLAQLADGTWNFASLLRMLPADTAAPQPAGPPGMPFRLDVSHLELTDASLYFDAGAHGHIRGINLRVDASLDTTLVPRGTVRLTVTEHGAPHLLAVLPPAGGAPGRSLQSGLRLSLNVRMDGLSDIVLQGHASLESLQVHAPGLPAAPVSAGTDLDISADITGGTVSINSMALHLNDACAAELTGAVSGLTGAPAGTLHVTGGTLPLARLNAYLPAAVPGLALGGTVTLAGTHVTFAADSALTAFNARVTPAVRLAGAHGRYRAVPLTADAARIRITGTAAGSYDTRSSAGSGRVSAALAMENIRLALPDMRPVRIDSVRAALQAATGPDFMPRSITASLAVRGPGNARFHTADTLRIRQLPFDADLNGSWELTDLDLADLPVSVPASGIISLSGSAAGSSYSRITLRTDIGARDLSVPYRDDELRFPPLQMRAGATVGFADAAFRDITVDAIDFDLDGILAVTGSASAESLGRNGVTADLYDCSIDLGRLAALLPEPLIRQFPVLAGMELSGILRTGIDLHGTPAPASEPAAYLSMAAGTVTVGLDEVACTLPGIGAGMERLNGTAGIELGGDGAALTLNAGIAGAWFHTAAAGTLEALTVGLAVRTPDLSRLAVDRLDITVPGYGLTAGITGTVQDIMSSTPFANLTLQADLDTDLPVVPVPGVTCTGRAGVRLHAAVSADPADTVRVSGSIGFDAFDVTVAPGISVTGISGSVPFRQSLVPGIPQLLPSLHTAPVNAGLDYLEFSANRALYRATLPDLGYLRIAWVRYDQYQAGDIAVDLRYRDNRLDVRRFAVNDLYHGNLAGALQVYLGDGRPENLLRTVSYGMVVQLAEVDADSLILSIPRLRAIHTKSLGRTGQAKIGADITLTGTGLDLAANPEINGAFNFSKIGSRVANDLLYLLDPEGRDRSINQTRFLLKRGARPDNMRFTVRQNFLYTSIYLDMPRYIRWNPLINIPQPIEYARTPIITTMKNLGVL